MSSYFYSTIQSTQTSAVGVVTAAYSLSVLADVPSSPERLGRSYTKPQHMSAPHRTDRVHTSWGHKVPTSVIHTVYRLHLPVVLKLGFKSFSSATDIHGSLHSHSTCSAPPEILVKGSWGLFISEQTQCSGTATCHVFDFKHFSFANPVFTIDWLVCTGCS